jgi:hypothetical protein
MLRKCIVLFAMVCAVGSASAGEIGTKDMSRSAEGQIE